MNRGKWLILMMIAAGIGAGTLKIWRQHQHMDQVLANFSPSVVRLIAESPQAELLRLELVSSSATPPAENTLEIEGRRYEIVDRKSLIGRKGFVDVRDRLVDDASYRWDGPIESSEGNWQYVLQFADGKHRARLAFDIRGEQTAMVKRLDDGPILSADPIADGLATFFAAQFEESAAAATMQ
jgi:hypothetical protein